MSHRWLIMVSMSAHLAVAGGLFVAGAWKLERLDKPNLTPVIFQPLAPPAPSGGPVAQTKPVEFKPKLHLTHEVAQPPTQKTPDKPVDTGTGDPGTVGKGSGDPGTEGVCTGEQCGQPAATPPAVCGNGVPEVGEQCDDGNQVSGDGCSATCQIEVKPRPQLQTVTPNVLSALRISGTTQIRPDETTQQQMVRDGTSKAVGTVKLCVGVDGGVTSARMLTSTRFTSYDATLLSAVYGWRYQPYSVGGVTVPACSTVTFIYRTE